MVKPPWCSPRIPLPVHAVILSSKLRMFMSPSRSPKAILKDVGTAVEKAMSDLLGRIGKLHDSAGKLKAPHNPDPNGMDQRWLACMYALFRAW